MARLRAWSRRRWLTVAALVLVAGVGGIVAWNWAFTGDPSAGEIREALAGIVDGRCASEPRVQEVDDIGGPGLPEGMWRAREVVCDPKPTVQRTPHPEEPFDRLAVQYVFRSGGAAKSWVRDSGDAPERENWLINGRTVVGGVALTDDEWQRLLTAVED